MRKIEITLEHLLVFNQELTLKLLNKYLKKNSEINENLILFLFKQYVEWKTKKGSEYFYLVDDHCDRSNLDQYCLMAYHKSEMLNIPVKCLNQTFFLSRPNPLNTRIYNGLALLSHYESMLLLNDLLHTPSIEFIKIRNFNKQSYKKVIEVLYINGVKNIFDYRICTPSRFISQQELDDLKILVKAKK